MPIRTLSPIDGSVLVERPDATPEQIDAVLDGAVAAFPSWRDTPLAERVAALERFVDAFVSHRDEIAWELTQQMGRPIRYAAGEVSGFEERARTMLRLAPDALADVVPPAKDGFKRFVRREPLGVVLVLAPWNYPYLCAVNAIVPALAAGNTVVLKHSAQTPLCSERLAQAAEEAGLPAGVFSYVHATHDAVAGMVQDPRVSFVAFTGSVEGGHAVVRAGSDRFVGMGLELGGKDPAYVRADADIAFAVDNVMDGVMFNSGQSCCGVERIYVHTDVYDAFVQGAVGVVKRTQLGDPLDPNTTMGPMVRPSAADFVRKQVADAVAAGAKTLIDPSSFAADGGAYLAPQLLVDVDHSMELMTEESFGPVVGIMRVSGDDEAVALMNDSRFGLTASIWSTDPEAAEAIGRRLETGTVFLNRCDVLDPELAWVGVKDSGRGCTLSSVGYENLTRPKSFHLRLP